MRISIFFLFICSISIAQTVSPVTNINFQQEGDDKIIITYDLIGSTKDLFDITVRIDVLNVPKGIVPKNATGDIGKNVSGGRNKTIIWNVLKDIELIDGKMKVVIMANQINRSKKEAPHNNHLWVRLGSSIVSTGGSVLLIVGFNKMKEGKTIYKNYETTTDPTKFQQDYGSTRSEALASSKTAYSQGRTLSIVGGTLVAISSFLLVKQIFLKKLNTPRLGLVPTSDGNIGIAYRF